jgi:toxin ParE1/3/4
MIVVLTAAAEADLEAIGDWIAADNPNRALSFIEELHRCCQTLGTAPRRYPLVPRYKAVGIRRRVHRDYLIFYRISGKTVEILHILHGAQDYEVILFPQGPPG